VLLHAQRVQVAVSFFRHPDVFVNLVTSGIALVKEAGVLAVQDVRAFFRFLAGLALRDEDEYICVSLFESLHGVADDLVHDTVGGNANFKHFTRVA